MTPETRKKRKLR